jgi:hypothetical protein
MATQPAWVSDQQSDAGRTWRQRLAPLARAMDGAVHDGWDGREGPQPVELPLAAVARTHYLYRWSRAARETPIRCHGRAARIAAAEPILRPADLDGASLSNARPALPQMSHPTTSYRWSA